MNTVSTFRAVALASIFSLCACTAEPLPPLTVTDLEITAPLPGTMMSAAYMVITNNTDAAIDVTSVSSPQFDRVEMHETVVENNIARMRPLDELHIEARGNVTLGRGGKHLMLLRPLAPVGTFNSATIELHSGDTFLLSVSANLSH